MAAAAANLPERGVVVMVEVAAEVAERGGMAPHRFPHMAEGVVTSVALGAQTAA
jgi:hypothetical protein